ncbi:MAG TPA: hypothetical protein VKD26_13700, partial [Streptosporangiaceae bacterium]|nr:hypothetical protein [Streptosporangiaceae bacterium]
MTPPAPVPPRVPGPPRAPVVPSVPAVPAPVPGGRAARGFTVDPWDPSYGLAVRDEPDGGLGESSAQLDLDLELAAGRWRPVDPDPTTSLPGSLLFLDGVRRVDARIWLHGGGPEPAPGIAASFAAGLVCCNSVARIEAVTVHRGLFTAAAGAADIATRHGRYPARRADAGGLDQLSLALQRGLADAEVQLAVMFRASHPGGDDVLVVDGPLRGRSHLERTVGYIKTHHASYLPGAQATVVASLAPGQRTPVFAMGTSWRRISWYLRLPGADSGAGSGAIAGPGAGASSGLGAGSSPGSGAGSDVGVPWSGVVRLECSADLTPVEAIRLADLTARVLP